MRAIIALFITVAAALGVWTVGRDTVPLLIDDIRAVPYRDGSVSISLTLRNAGGPDMLVSVSSPDAQVQTTPNNAETLPIPAQTTVTISPDSAAILLTGLDEKLTEGRLIPLSLTFQKAGTLRVKARLEIPVLMSHGMMMGTAYGVPETEPQPEMTLDVEAAPDDTWRVELKTQGFKFSKALADGPHQPGTGHGHLYIGGVKLTRLYQPNWTIPALPSGTHRIRVTLNTNDHRTYEVKGKAVTASVDVTVP